MHKNYTFYALRTFIVQLKNMEGSPFALYKARGRR